MNWKALLLGCAVFCVSAITYAGIDIIPQPVELEEKSGVFKLNADEYVLGSAAHIQYLRAQTGLTLQAGKSTRFFLIAREYFQSAATASRPSGIDYTIEPQLGNEGYRLNVTPDKVSIVANTDTGVFYGIQTFLQLLPPEIESDSKTARSWEIPCVEIVDYPRFEWRGLLLDVSRHWFTKGEVKRYIDQMSRYKLNVFHFHLTDDQGWRLEIPELPELAKIGSKRVPRVGHWWNRDVAKPGEEATYGGYYTLDDIKEIVDYAAARHVRVIPEIDVPGHSLALLTVYPELACKPDSFHVNSGWKFYNITQNTVCIANPKTYEIMDKVLDVVSKHFPDAYIHIGGDEATKKFWNACPKCKALIASEKLKNADGLQSHFIRRMEKLIESKGKRLIGWDEITQGGLPPNATVMCWRSDGRSGAQAAAKGHKVVMTPERYYYIDLYQGEPIAEPNTYSMLRLKTSYQHEPQPKGVPDSLMMGIQGCLWGESVPNYRHAEYMTWPRAFAVAESAWSPAVRKDWKSFTERVERHFKRLDEADVNYARSMYNVEFRPKKSADGALSVELATELYGMTIRYTFDNTNPDHHSPIYTSPLSVPLNAVELRVNTFRGKTPMGTQINMPIETLKDRAGIK